MYWKQFVTLHEQVWLDECYSIFLLIQIMVLTFVFRNKMLSNSLFNFNVNGGDSKSIIGLFRHVMYNAVHLRYNTQWFLQLGCPSSHIICWPWSTLLWNATLSQEKSIYFSGFQYESARRSRSLSSRSSHRWIYYTDWICSFYPQLVTKSCCQLLFWRVYTPQLCVVFLRYLSTHHSVRIHM